MGWEIKFILWLIPFFVIFGCDQNPRIDESTKKEIRHWDVYVINGGELRKDGYVIDTLSIDSFEFNGQIIEKKIIDSLLGESDTFQLSNISFNTYKKDSVKFNSSDLLLYNIFLYDTDVDVMSPINIVYTREYGVIAEYTGSHNFLVVSYFEDSTGKVYLKDIFKEVNVIKELIGHEAYFTD